MKLWEVFRFEVAYHARRPSTWLYLVALAALSFLTATGMLVEETERAGEVHVNAPISVAVTTVIISWLGMLVTAALVGDAGRPVEGAPSSARRSWAKGAAWAAGSSGSRSTSRGTASVAAASGSR